MTANPEHGRAPTRNLAAEVRETHSAIVLLAGDRAYKIKKPVDLGFLDFRDERTRAHVCHRELELNRRLASDVYLDVISIAGSDGRSVEHGVLMRRMPEALRLSTMIAQGDDVEEHLRALAELLARFHANAVRGPKIAAEGTATGLRRRWMDNLRETRTFRGSLLAATLHAEISRLALNYVAGRTQLLAERAAAGLVVDGHGDLTAEDVFCLPDYPRALDCIEFDDRLRWLDTLDDAAFLCMDLEHVDRPDLAKLFMHHYIEFSGTPIVASLEHHYIAYRAFVRAKVTYIQAAQGRAEAAAEADQYAHLALRHLEAGEVTLTLVGGIPGSGKTTLARALLQRDGCAALLSSDALRHSAAITTADRYSDAARAATYEELLDHARTALQHGESVIADATWGDTHTRDMARALAAETSSRMVAVECRLPVEIAAGRAQQRLEQGADHSEAGANVARKLAACRVPWPDAITVDTSGTREQSLKTTVTALAKAQRNDSLTR